MPRVNPEIIVWARETAGLTIDDAATRVGFSGSSVSSAADKLTAIEDGWREPTRPQLLKMADTYRRPLLTFYLSRPPAKSDRGADFRTLRGETSVGDDALLDALLRDIRARQSMIRSVLEDEEEAIELPFVGSHSVSDEIHEVLTSLRNLLGIELQDYRSKRNADDGFALLRDHAERVGVFVVIRNDLGNYRTALETGVFRGIAISDPIAPFIVINGQDARSAWSFTLLHELVHILLGQTGVGNSNTEQDSERFCDDVASAYLLHPYEIVEARLFDDVDFQTTVEKISAFAAARNISMTMVAYNSYLGDLIDVSTYREYSRFFHDRWKEQRERERARSRNSENGPDYYVVQRHRIGRSMLSLAKRMMGAGALSTSKAAKILGIKPKQVHRMLETTL